jgi:hypothetical protein
VADRAKDGRMSGFGTGDPVYFASADTSNIFKVALASSVANTFSRKGGTCSWKAQMVNRDSQPRNIKAKLTFFAVVAPGAYM